MNRLLWFLQTVLALFFFVAGIIHFTIPAGFPAVMSWMNDLPVPLHFISGGVEILASAALVLPAAARIEPRITPLAAVGLFSVMILGAVFHAWRGEYAGVVTNLVVAVVAGFVGYGRWRIVPILLPGAHD